MITPLEFSETPPSQYFYHMSDHSVQCAIGLKTLKRLYNLYKRDIHSFSQGGNLARQGVSCVVSPSDLYYPFHLRGHRTRPNGLVNLD